MQVGRTKANVGLTDNCNLAEGTSLVHQACVLLVFTLSEFDIPEERGNVVVLYEACLFSRATYEQFWLTEQKISPPHTFTRIL